MTPTYSPPNLVVLTSAKGRSEIAGGLDDWRVHRVQHAVTATQGRIRLSKLSQQFGLSTSHIGRRFKHTYGIGFRRYSVELRLAHAVHLLQTSNMPIKEIAGRSGYQHCSDLSYQFKQAFGVSPTQLRQYIRLLKSETDDEFSV